MTAAEDNAAVVRRYRDLVWNNGEVPAIEELVDDDFTNFGIGGWAATPRCGTSSRPSARRSPTCTRRAARAAPSDGHSGG